MNQQEFLVPEDLSFRSPDTTIKSEDIKDEDDILLFAQLDNLTNNMANNEFQIVQEVEVVDQLQAAQSDFAGKLPIDLNNLSTNSELQYTGGNTSHYVRYKLQDGKHVKIWECGICSKEFTHQYTLMRHLPTHTDERKFQCNTCGKASSRSPTIIILNLCIPFFLLNPSFPLPQPFVKCPPCRNIEPYTLLRDRTYVRSARKLSIVCNLRNHVFTHTNERPYKCDICDKGFNQMSNLMCHKLKAHQRAEKPKYVCQICGKYFPKRMGLRHHEQYTHGMLNNSLSMPPIPEKPNYINAVMVEPIKTEAMRLALESNQTPFALLRPLTGIPVLVRVLPAGDKQMLVPASAEDLKKHSHISITSKAGAEEEKEIIEKSNGKQAGSTVQIKIPVVATVIQQSEQGGNISMAVVSPGPNGGLINQSSVCNFQNDGFIYSSSLIGGDSVTVLVVLVNKGPGIRTVYMKELTSDIPPKVKSQYFDTSKITKIAVNTLFHSTVTTASSGTLKAASAGRAGVAVSVGSIGRAVRHRQPKTLRNVNDIEEMPLSNPVISANMMSGVEIEFLDNQGRRVGAEEFKEVLRRECI
ncbi:hypothetical protein NQ317_005359 [Molorchus minor]|uniref:C2H2-type domain-containing protein n=1 Tax=Molorchus minor TaxID=1323400 RepID=A0ABQ9J213_9CUCU|nr:hypothetical protein NQ317_005359 [Molorchus minor]